MNVTLTQSKKIIYLLFIFCTVLISDVHNREKQCYFNKPNENLSGKSNLKRLELLPPTSGQLLIDVAVDNTSPAAGDIITYKFRYRYASTTEHGSNSEIQFTFPSAYEVVTLASIGGNISDISNTGNQYTIDLASPSSLGIGTGKLAAGSSGIFEFKVQFKCGTNGSGGIPAAGTTVNFTQNPRFTVTGVNNTASAPSAVTVPTVNVCTTPNNSSNYNEYHKWGSDIAGQGMYHWWALHFPKNSTTPYTYTDIFPSGFKLFDGIHCCTNFSSGWTVEVQANGSWWNITNFQTVANFINNVSNGAVLKDQNGTSIPGTMRVDASVSNGDHNVDLTTNYAEGVTGIRMTGSGNHDDVYLYFYIPNTTPVGWYQNCMTTDNPSYSTDCHEVYVTDKGSLTMGCWFQDVPEGLGTTTLSSSNGNTVSANYPNLYKDPMDIQGTLNGEHTIKTTAVENPTYEVLLPAGFDFIEGTSKPNYWLVEALELSTNPSSALEPDFTRIPDYNGTGRVLLQWDFPNLIFPAFGPHHLSDVKVRLRIYFSTRYMGTVSLPNPGSIIADATIRTKSVMTWTYGGSGYLGTPTQEIGCALHYGIPTSGGSVNSEKYVQGALDVQQSRYPISGNTNLSGDATYEMYVYNHNFQRLKEIDIADILPYIGDKDMLGTTNRSSSWSEELANAITVERYKIGSGLVDASSKIPSGVLYSNTYNACYLDGALPAGQVTADMSAANTGQSASCTDFSSSIAAVGAKGFAFRWTDSAEPLEFGEYLKITVNVTQLTGEADMTNNEVAWNSFAYTATEEDDDVLFSSEPLKVGVKMVDVDSKAAFCGTIWEDINGNGERAPGEPLLEGVTVYLYDAAQNPVTESVIINGVTSNIQVTTITDSLGHYCFYGLNPNDAYFVRLENPNDYTASQVLDNLILTTLNATGNDENDSDATMGTLTGSSATPYPKIAAVTDGAGTVADFFDFGFYKPSSLGNYVWLDDDAEGDQDASEAAVQGVTMTLKKAITLAIVATDVTDVNGQYIFENIAPGDYYVEATSGIPVGKTATGKQTTGNNETDSDFNYASNIETDVISLISGENRGDIDLGLRDNVVNPASICGRTWDDLNEDGRMDVGEPSQPRVTINLLDANGFVLSTTISEEDGDYCFNNLEPGVTYQLVFILPSPTGSNYTNAGSNMDANSSTGVTLTTYTPTNNQGIVGVDCGFIGPFSIGNLVWSDVNNNGVWDTGESAYSNVKLYLFNSTGSTILDSTTTDAYGKYVFTNLSQGTYRVAVVLPNNTKSSIDVGTSTDPNAADDDDNGLGIGATGYIMSAPIDLEFAGGSNTGQNWLEFDHGERIDGAFDPSSNPKAYYTMDFGLVSVSTENCFDGVDNDGDGLVDCLDPDCGSGTQITNTTLSQTGSPASTIYFKDDGTIGNSSDKELTLSSTGSNKLWGYDDYFATYGLGGEIYQTDPSDSPINYDGLIISSDGNHSTETLTFTFEKPVKNLYFSFKWLTEQVDDEYKNGIEAGEETLDNFTANQPITVSFIPYNSPLDTDGDGNIDGNTTSWNGSEVRSFYADGRGDVFISANGTPFTTFSVRHTQTGKPWGFVMEEIAYCVAEVCNNGVDDDGDGQIDIADEDCSCNLSGQDMLWLVDEEEANIHLWSYSDYRDENTGVDYGLLDYYHPTLGTVEYAGDAKDMEALAVNPYTGMAYFLSSSRIPGGPSGTQTLFQYDLNDAVNNVGNIVLQVVGQIARPTSSWSTEALAYDPVSNRFYTADPKDGDGNSSTSTDDLYYIDLNNMNPDVMQATIPTLIGPISGMSETNNYVDGLEFDGSGNLYAIDGTDEELYQISPSTGAIIAVVDNNLAGGTGHGSIDVETICWDESNQKMLALNNDHNEIIELDLTQNGNNTVLIDYLNTPGMPGSADMEGSAMFNPCTPKMSIGNLVFKDNDNNNVFTAGEGVDNVIVELYQSGTDPSTNSPITKDTTSGGGFYLFEDLQEGDYFVHIPSSEFASSEPLDGLFSTSVTGIDNGIDNDDNGVDAVTPTSAGVSSVVFNLSENTEPTNGGTETGSGNTVDDSDDNNGDMTIDFGFSSNVCNSGVDSDNDGIRDVCDDDDDNDGILDVDECPTPTSSGLTGPLTTFTAHITTTNASSNAVPHTLDSITYAGTVYRDFIVPDTYTPGFTLTDPTGVSFVKEGSFLFNIGSNASYNTDILPAFQSRNLNAYQDLDRNDFSNGDYFDLKYNTPVISTAGGFIAVTERGGNNPQVIQALDASGAVIGTAVNVATSDYVDVGVRVDPSGSQNANIALYPIDALASVGTEIHGIRISFGTGGVTTTDGPDAKAFLFGNVNQFACDYDGDGIPNHQDLDSDNDGCPDALEGGGSFTTADLTNNRLTGGVGVDGIPNVAGSGQAIGSSQDVNTSACPEICNNNIDDDGDGYIDNFDSDCPCTNFTTGEYYNNCVTCEAPLPLGNCFDMQVDFITQDLSAGGGDVQNYTMSYIGDMDNDGDLEIVGKSSDETKVYLFNGKTGLLEWTLSDGPSNPGGHNEFCIGDVDGDGMGEIYFANNTQVKGYEFNGSGFTQKFATTHNLPSSSPILNNNMVPQLADFNQDGTPELFIGSKIFNSNTGASIVYGGDANTFGRSGSTASNSVAVDILPDAFCGDCGGLELVAGEQIFSVNIATNTMTVVVNANLSGSTIRDGKTSIADVDNDGDLDVIFTHHATSPRFYAYDGQTGNNLIANGNQYTFTNGSVTATGLDYVKMTNTGGGSISQPNIIDVDNDGLVEFVFVSKNKLICLENDFTLKWYKDVVDLSSGFTTTSSFDLNGDNFPEVLYGSEDSIYIISGVTGATLENITRNSGSSYEYPTVADVDQDGASEILISSGNSILVFESACQAWMPSRGVINQVGYFGMNVNDDLTIPQYQQNHHLQFPAGSGNRPFNGFLNQQGFYDDNGDEFYPSPNLVAALDSVGTIEGTNKWCGDSVRVYLTLTNAGMLNMGPEVPISVYDGNPTTTAATLLKTFTSNTTVLPNSGNEKLAINVPVSAISTVYVVVNDGGVATANLPYTFTAPTFPNTQWGECSYEVLTVPLGFCSEICNDGIDNDGDGLIDCADPDCGIVSIDNVVISSCIDQPYADVAKLDVTVSWLTASTDTIEVTISGKTEYIDVGSSTSPVTVSFMVPADGSANNAIAAKFQDKICESSATYNAPAACSNDQLFCSILYICGDSKGADADAFDHGLLDYIDGINGNAVLTPALAKNEAGMGLYDPMNSSNALSITLTDYDIIFISSTTWGYLSSDLLTDLKDTEVSILTLIHEYVDDLGMSSSQWAATQEYAYSDNTTQVQLYNFNNTKPHWDPLVGVSNYLAGTADAYLWRDANHQSSDIQGVFYHYTASDNLTGVAATHGSRTYLGYYMDGVYWNDDTNQGATPVPQAEWFDPIRHLTQEGKYYLDQALILASQDCTIEDCTDNIDNDGDGLIDCADPDCEPVIANVAITQPTCTNKTGGQIVVTATGSGTLEYSVKNEATWQSSNTFTNLGVGQYTIRVRNDSGCEVEYISNPVILDMPTCVEICNDGIDNDGDGLIDCDDPDCDDIGGASGINN